MIKCKYFPFPLVFSFTICLLGLLLILDSLPNSQVEAVPQMSTKLGSNRNFILIQQQPQSQPSGRSASNNDNTKQHHHQHHQRQQHQQPVDTLPNNKQRNLNENESNTPSVRYSLTSEEETASAGTTAYQNDDTSATVTSQQQQQQQQQIFINQSNNIYILAKYGQVVYLPCVVFKHKDLDSSGVHVIWHRLYEKSRPVVLSIGMQQMKQDMRYRVKVHTLSKSRNGAGLGSGSHSGSPDDPLVFESDHHHHHHHHDNNDEQIRINDMVKRDNGSTEWGPPTPAVTTTTVDPRDDYIIQNWQFEIRKLTFDDAGTYQCLLPLVKPISKNITLQVIPDLTIEPKDGTNYKLDDKIVLKCRATMRTLHKTPSLHLIHQRQSKSSILWYKENEIIKSSSPPSTSTDIPNDDNDDDEKISRDAEHKIEIETKLDNNEQTLNSILTIYKARETDSGKYRCIYDNIQENVQIKVINDHYEYKKYLSSVNNNSAAKTTTTAYFTTSHTIFFLFISILSF